jgi:hypothetical protein
MQLGLAFLFLARLSSISVSASNHGQVSDSTSSIALAASEEEEEVTSSSSASVSDILQEDEQITLIMDCSILSQSDREMRSFLMESLNLSSQNTLDDLKVPLCRAAFDIACGDLSRAQMAQMMAQPDGLEILNAGQCLESFSDFSDFNLATFAQFPELKIASIRHWTSIKPEILLALMNAVGFASLGRIDIFPERVGMEALLAQTWIEHPSIWQLFLIEGVKHLPAAHKQAFAQCLATERRIERLLAGQSSAYEEIPRNWRTVGNCFF